jgi:LAO/AO transport system kinase
MARKRPVNLEQLVAGDRVAIARAISVVENESEGAEELLREIYERTGRAYRIGITGPPGAGKSTITNRLAQYYRREGRTVGIIAVDPTSPFTGGALLGDRVRMTDVELDAGVFIRLDAAGKDVVIFETVGVGQSELDIAGAADTTVVVLVPESGDSIQAMKAGLMEIADFFVLNKADRAGAEQAVMSLRMILHFRPLADGWTPDVLQSVASEGTGTAEIAAKIAEHRLHLEHRGGLRERRRRRAEGRVRELVADRLLGDFWTVERLAVLHDRIGLVEDHRTTPYDLAQQLIDDFHVHEHD